MSSTHWEVPYLPIDPVDVGRTYEAVIRINSQSGKGGVAYLLERDRGFDLPRRQQVEFSQIVQGIVEETGRELTSDEIADAFEREYLSSGAFSVEEHREDTLVGHDGRELRTISAVVSHNGVEHVVQGRGNGPIDAFVDGMARHFGLGVCVSDYREHSVGQGADAVAVAYVEVVRGDVSPSSPSTDASDAAAFFGVGRDSDIVTASLRAVISAVNRAEVRRAANEPKVIEQARKRATQLI
jgi:2-isopropylmalate synthase